jgi:hypothetical protein
VADRSNIPEHTMDWLVKVTDQVNFPENKKYCLIQVTDHNIIFL